jgi:hypothetical protein
MTQARNVLGVTVMLTSDTLLVTVSSEFIVRGRAETERKRTFGVGTTGKRGVILANAVVGAGDFEVSVCVSTFSLMNGRYKVCFGVWR